jgi:LPXTG-site transpeptidase (sortase) family protein
VIKFLIAFCVGLAVTLWLVARDARRAGLQGRAPRCWQMLALTSALVAVVLAGQVLARWVGAERSGLALATPPAVAEPSVLAPARLLIPSLEIDAHVVYLPLQGGTWNVGGLDDAVGHLGSTGARPGDELAMAFTGHVTLSAQRRGPFADLWMLQPLDEIIYRAGGVDYVYAVDDVSTVAPEAAGEVYVRRGGTLLLVTCTNWDYLAEVYRGRLLVRAVFVKQIISSTSSN